MSVDLSLILPNDCHNIKDNALAMKVFNDTIRRVIDYFAGQEDFISDIVIRNSDSPEWRQYCDPSDPTDDDYEEYRFNLPLIHTTCNLRQGYWDIWIHTKYSSYFWPSGFDKNGSIYLWPRTDAFNVARAFGFSEGWICDEYHSWNSLLEEDSCSASFEQWCKYGESDEDSCIYEFSLEIFNGSTNRLMDYRSKYHDSFAECHALVAKIEEQYPDYKLLSICTPTKAFALATKGKNLYILNVETGESLTPFPIDCCHANFNGVGFSLFKDGKQAFFTAEGRQITDFREGGFSWRWDSSRDGVFDVAITDKATGRRFICDGTEVAFEDE